jgi:MFS family permease
MAANDENPSSPGDSSGVWDIVLAGRPILPLAVVWLTTAGHTMNFREMGIGKGWVAADVYSLHSVYLAAIPLVLLASPALSQHYSSRRLTRFGLAIMATGSFLNGLDTHASLSVFLFGRLMAGVGAGLVIYFAPRLIDSRWENPTSYASILLPVAGPAVIAGASMIYGWSSWEWGFLMVGVAALLSLIVLGSEVEATAPAPPARRTSLAFLPFLTLGIAALLYCLHWGQLHGWLESIDILVAVVSGTLFLLTTLILVYPQLDLLVFSEGWIRLVLFFFGGVVQFFHGTTMTIYSGMFVNFSSWQRSWLVWSMPLGVAASLLLARLALRRWRVSLGLPGAVAGLLILAGGMTLLREATLEWPYWQIQNVVDLNWFPAPQHWELAPGRFLVGLGLGLLMFAIDTMFSADPEREETIRPFLLVTQFWGGSIGIGLLISFLLVSHPIHYSYVADRDYIQAEESVLRRAALRDELNRSGDTAADRRAEVLQFRAANYEADNLVYADIYATFTMASLGLAGLCAGCSVWNWLRPTLGTGSHDRRQ